MRGGEESCSWCLPARATSRSEWLVFVVVWWMGDGWEGVIAAVVVLVLAVDGWDSDAVDVVAIAEEPIAMGAEIFRFLALLSDGFGLGS